jgi:hypothetical protein
MTVRTLTTIAMLAVAAFASGCGSPDCEGLCKEMNGCEGAVAIDCAQACATEALNEKASCEDQFDEVWTCVGNRDDVCQAQYVCEPRFGFYADCLAGYCINQQADHGVNPAGDDQADADCAKLGL